MINTLIIDSHKQDREKISSLLSTHNDIRVLACGKDGYDALNLTGCYKPDIVILENHLDYINGGEITPLLRIRSPSTAVIIITAMINDYELYTAVVNKVSGFLMKTDMEILPVILNYIIQGGCFISPAMGARLLHILSSMNMKDPVDMFDNMAAETRYRKKTRKPLYYSPGFSPREDPTGYLSKIELSILTHIGRGYSSEEIAKNVSLAVGTVRNYISSVMRKTGLANRSQLARFACRYGLVPVNW